MRYLNTKVDKEEINYKAITKKFWNAVLHFKTYHSAGCRNDPLSVVYKQNETIEIEEDQDSTQVAIGYTPE